MNKLYIIFLLTMSMFLLSCNNLSAEDYVAENSASLITNDKPVTDYRVEKLRTYLESKNSPMSETAETFVTYADEHKLDWRLVPAISGVESSFGKRIPYKSYNAYGWANGKYNFESWDDSVEVVSKTLREKYIDRGLVGIDEIGRVYAPPSDTWSNKVVFFMEDIDPIPLVFTLEN